MCCGTALWRMVPSHAAQDSTVPLGLAPHILHIAQVLVANAQETSIGYTGMVIVAYCPRLSDPFACYYVPHVCILA